MEYRVNLHAAVVSPNAAYVTLAAAIPALMAAAPMDRAGRMVAVWGMAADCLVVGTVMATVLALAMATVVARFVVLVAVLAVRLAVGVASSMPLRRASALMLADILKPRTSPLALLPGRLLIPITQHAVPVTSCRTTLLRSVLIDRPLRRNETPVSLKWKK